MGWTKETFKDHWKESDTAKYWAKDWKKSHYAKEFSKVFPILAKIEWDSLLEIGCGNGKNLEILNKRYKNKAFSGTDINPDFIEEAIEKGLLIEHCDTENLKVAFAPDIILSWEHLQHLHPNAFNGAVKKIKESGAKYLILYEGFKNVPEGVMKAGAGGRWSHNYLEHFKGKHMIKDNYLLMLAKL